MKSPAGFAGLLRCSILLVALVLGGCGKVATVDQRREAGNDSAQIAELIPSRTEEGVSQEQTVTVAYEVRSEFQTKPVRQYIGEDADQAMWLVYPSFEARPGREAPFTIHRVEKTTHGDSTIDLVVSPVEVPRQEMTRLDGSPLPAGQFSDHAPATSLHRIFADGSLESYSLTESVMLEKDGERQSKAEGDRIRRTFDPVAAIDSLAAHAENRKGQVERDAQGRIVDVRIPRNSGETALHCTGYDDRGFPQEVTITTTVNGRVLRHEAFTLKR